MSIQGWPIYTELKLLIAAVYTEHPDLYKTIKYKYEYAQLKERKFSSLIEWKPKPEVMLVYPYRYAIIHTSLLYVPFRGNNVCVLVRCNTTFMSLHNRTLEDRLLIIVRYEEKIMCFSLTHKSCSEKSNNNHTFLSACDRNTLLSAITFGCFNSRSSCKLKTSNILPPKC